MKAALVIALDFPDAKSALTLARQLHGIVPWVKVGLELYLAAGPELIARLKDMGFLVFLDLKFMDIPNTVRAAVSQGTRQGADMMTIHTLGGQKMCAAAVAGREQALKPGQTAPLLFGVTLLTSLGPEDLVWNTQANADDLRDTVTRLALAAQSWNLDGVVCSGGEICAIRRTCAASLQILTPGIRLPDADIADQTRVCTPAQAVREGSNFLVVGRPVTRAENPAYAARQYLEQIF